MGASLPCLQRLGPWLGAGEGEEAAAAHTRGLLQAAAVLEREQV